MNNYMHILVGVDFSDNSRSAAMRAAALAQQNGATLTLLHVVEHFPEDIPVNPIPPEDVDPATFYQQHANATLSKMAEELGYQRTEQAVVISSKSANHELLEWARGQQVDLIVVGTHEGDTLGALGSTAMAISHHAPCDVLVVRPGAHG